MTVQQLCDSLQVINHQGHSQLRVKVVVGDGHTYSPEIRFSTNDNGRTELLIGRLEHESE